MIDRTTEITSICVVTDPDDNGQSWLLRLLDIEGTRLVPVYINESESRTFDNRDKLYYNDNTMPPGYVGVWHWSATPRLNDYEKDYFHHRVEHHCYTGNGSENCYYRCTR